MAHLLPLEYPSARHRKAIEAADEEIYPELSSSTSSPFHIGPDYLERRCAFTHAYTPQNTENMSYQRRSENIPFTRHDLHDFLQSGLDKYHGYWSIFWAGLSPKAGDIIYPDQFRHVMSFRSIEFMIRPPNDFANTQGRKGHPGRL